MELVLSCICIIIAIIALLTLVITYNYQKYQILLARIEEAQKNIEYFLTEKQENLEQVIPIIKESNKRKYDKKNILENLIKNKSIKQNLHEKDDSLRADFKEFVQLLEDDEKLTKIKELNEIYFEAIEIENDLNASKKYYNKIAKKIEEEGRKFPRNILKGILKYESLQKFNTKKEVTLEILKEEEKQTNSKK